MAELPLDEQRELHRLHQQILNCGFDEGAVAAAPPAHQALFRATRMLTTFDRLRAQMLRAVMMSSQESTVLPTLWDRGPMSIGELAAASSMSRSAMSHLVDRLVERGYVTRSEDPTDRRRTIVAIGGGGYAAVDGLWFDAQLHVAERISELDAEQIETLYDGIDRYCTAFDEISEALVKLDDSQLRTHARTRAECHEQRYGATPAS